MMKAKKGNRKKKKRVKKAASKTPLTRSIKKNKDIIRIDEQL